METKKVQLLIIGGGPGGYAAAFRAADLGVNVTLVEKHETLGGVCLNVGCIPSKALLHVAEAAETIKHASLFGLETKDTFKVNTKKLVAWKQEILKKLTGGLKQMAALRKVEYIIGEAEFLNDAAVTVKTKTGVMKIEYDKCIIACGSRNRKLPDDENLPLKFWYSTEALEVERIPSKLLIIGGGVIGLEMGTFYSSLGSEVTILQRTSRLLPMVDKDLMNIFLKANSDRFKKIYYEHGTKEITMKGKDKKFTVEFENLKNKETFKEQFDNIVVSIGRIPNSDRLSLEKTCVRVDERGFIITNELLQTSCEKIYAIGDIIGNPMLAHKSTYEGRIVAEIIAGENVFRDKERIIPSVVYTSPEIAWAGLTEQECVEQKIKFQKGELPWMASGKALTAEAALGKTKLIFDEKGYIIGGGIVGKHADDLISEILLAIEMKAHIKDITMTVHPHPTLSETIALSAEIAEGTVTDYYVPKILKK